MATFDGDIVDVDTEKGKAIYDACVARNGYLLAYPGANKPNIFFVTKPATLEHAANWVNEGKTKEQCNCSINSTLNWPEPGNKFSLSIKTVPVKTKSGRAKLRAKAGTQVLVWYGNNPAVRKQRQQIKDWIVAKKASEKQKNENEVLLAEMKDDYNRFHCTQCEQTLPNKKAMLLHLIRRKDHIWNNGE